jgi:hypothetical protein
MAPGAGVFLRHDMLLAYEFGQVIAASATPEVVPNDSAFKAKNEPVFEILRPNEILQESLHGRVIARKPDWLIRIAPYRDIPGEVLRGILSTDNAAYLFWCVYNVHTSRKSIVDTASSCVYV